MKGQGFGVKGFVFTGEQVAYCVGDASQAQNDNGEIRELASELISANLRSFYPVLKTFYQKNRLVGGGFWFMLWLLVLKTNRP
jgi:hypothetical protein